ncbi:MAG: aldose 1-epimerase family protein [Bacteroidales bacterium]|nr:aldose 1-epimerase family protein [Bacteroidales bacterium]
MKLNNNKIAIEVSPHGAELLSLQYAGREYMWSGDAAFWNRHAPILFPAVGKPFENIIHIDGKAYTMKQHGFARDSKFEELDDGRMRMLWSADTYPYRCSLEARYRIIDNEVEVRWTVTNLDSRTMHFQIGAHPGFMLPDYDAAEAVHGYVRYLDRDGNPVGPVMVSSLEDGNRVGRTPVSFPECMPVTNDTFAHDALIFENGQVAEALLCDKQGRAVLSVSCPQAEAFGIWAPHKEGCPFVCLEPWCGICDAKGFRGDIADRTYSHCLAPDEHYEFTYIIKLL